ncbi:unnamed protein product [Cochlearia groenlandica]
MKKDEKKSLTGRTIYTRSVASSSSASIERELRRTNRGIKAKKPINPSSSARKSERLATSPAPAKSDKGKTVLSKNEEEGIDKSSENADTSLESCQRKEKREDDIEESINKIKKRERRSYRALFKNAIVDDPSNVEELVVVGCSRRVPAGNDDATPVSKRPPVSQNSLEEGTDASLELTGDAEKMVLDETPMLQTRDESVIGSPLEEGTDASLKLIGDTENMVLDETPMLQTRDESVIGSPSENIETKKSLFSETSLATNIDLPLKRKKDTAEIVLDACATVANAGDCVMSSSRVIPLPAGSKTNNKPEMCSTFEKRQKVNGVEDLSLCSSTSQPVQESDHVVQEIGPSTSRDCRESKQNMQQDQSHDPKLCLSMYPEYWVPVQLSGVQLEQYCWTLFSKSSSLSQPRKKDFVGAIEETLVSVRKTCDHPYVMDASLKQLLTKNLEMHEILDVEVKASGKLYYLDAMLKQVKEKGLKAVVFYQSTGGLLLGNMLEDFLGERFGQKSYEHVINEHGTSSSRKRGINNFNKESQCFVLLLEKRACTQNQSIKLLRAEAFILFGSSLNPSLDVKHVEKIKVESCSEKSKIFRLYSKCTVEERALILASKNKPVENLNYPLTHALLMWGASYLFDKLDHFHGSKALDSGLPFEQSIMDGVINEFSSLLSSNGGEETEAKQLSLLLEAKHAHGTYSTDSTLFGEEHVMLSDKDSPNIFWKKLLEGKNPMWRYYSDTPQRNRKRVQYFPDSEESEKNDCKGNTKKRKKSVNDVAAPTVTDSSADNTERKSSDKNHLGYLESPKVVALQSSCRSAPVTNGTLNGNDAFGLYSTGGHISGIPEDMLAGKDLRKIPRDSQRSLHAVLKSEMARLGEVLDFPEDWTSLVEKFLEYVIENHFVCEEPATILQAFQIALSWIAAFLVKHKFNREESLVRAKSKLAFSCSREEVDYIYSMLYCMKSLYLESAHGLQVDCFGTNSKQSMVSTKKVYESLSKGEESMTEKRGSHDRTATKDIKKTISDIEKKCKKKEQKLVQTHQEKTVELVNRFADKKQELQNNKKLEAAVIRIACSRSSTQSLGDDLKRLDHDYDRKSEEITYEKDECLKSLEQMHEAAKKKLAEDEACWISRIKKWARAELKKCAPIKSEDNKDFSGICLANTSKNAPDVQTCNNFTGEASCADTDCMVSRGNQVQETESILETATGGSTQQDYEMVNLNNDKAIDISTFPRGESASIVATKSQSNEHASITVPEILIPASCQEEFAVLNVHLSEYQTSDRMASAAADKDISSKFPEISQSCVNLAKSASPELSLNREEALVTTEIDRTSHVDSYAEKNLDQQDGEACSLEKEIPDELAWPVPQPTLVVETSDSTESDQDDQDTCPRPSLPAEKQLNPVSNIQGQDIEVEIEPQPTRSETVETGCIVTLEQVDQVACPLPSSPAENQPDLAAIIEGQNIEAPAEPQIASLDAGEIDDDAVSDQEKMGPHDTCSLPSALVGMQSDLAANIECQNITTVAQLHTAETDAVETGGTAVSDQPRTTKSDASLQISSPENHRDAAVNTERLNNTGLAESNTAGSDACEMEIAEPSPQVEQTTFATNLVHGGSVEPTSGEIARVPSPINNGTGQSTVPLVPQVPFPLFSDPFQHELEKLRRESENTKKTYEEKKSILKADFDRKMAEIEAEYQRNSNEVEVEHRAKTMEDAKRKHDLIMNKLLAGGFVSKCTNNNASQPSPISRARSRIQQIAVRAAQVNALRNYSAFAPALPRPPPPPPAPLQHQVSSYISSLPRTLGLPLHSPVSSMYQRRQHVVTSRAPPPSASHATTNQADNARRHLNAYRQASLTPTSIPIPTSESSPQALAYSNVLDQQQQQRQQQQRQQQNLGSNVVCLSDDERVNYS